ncbi:MAG: DUF305 domain-containing protein [Patescibacteria group bacterium]
MDNTTNKIWFILGGIGIGFLFAFVFLSSTRLGGMMTWRTSDSTQPVGQQVTNSGSLDRHFIEQMIPHHEGAVAMANLALQKAQHPEIKTLAAAIIEAQTAEIQSMGGWYQDWFGNAVPEVTTGMMGGGMMSQSGMHMGGQEDIAVLKNASDFDKAFIEQMIPHHQLAIMMAQMLQAGTSRPEMLELAQNIITSQSQEIQNMQEWYQAWY